MAGSTKLFQRAGSPLIQGHSRTARSFWADWALACLPAALLVYGVLGVATLVDTSRPSISSAHDVLNWLAQAAVGLAVMLPTCALGVAIARGMGWRRAWLLGAVLGTLAGVVVMLYTRALL